jgi:hypothetical protein
MSTVKISELPVIDHYSTNTEATLVVGVDLATGTTGKSTLTTLGEGLYAYQPLKVGQNQVLFANTIGQFSGNSNTFLQINHQNFNANGSTDYVASTSDSDNSTKYIDFGIDGPTYNDPINYPFFKPYDGYLYVYGPSSTSSSGNLIVGTASSNSTITFITGLSSYKNVVAKMTSTGLVLNTQSYITFGDGSVQSVAASPANYSTAAYAQANVTIGVDASQNSRMVIIEGVDIGQNTAITATDGKMQSAYNKANNALANTTGTFAGTLTVTGNVIANSGNIGNLTISNSAIYSSLTSVDMIIGQSIASANLVINRTTNITKDLNITGNVISNGTLIDFNNSTFNPNVAFIQITGSNNGITVAPSNTNYMLQITGKADSVTRLVIDSFGQNTYPVVIGRMGRGSADLPTATQNNDVMMRIVGNGYTGTQFPASSPTKIDFVAAENFSDANRGTQIQFWNTKVGTNTLSQIATFNADSATFTGTVAPTKGFIYTPLVYPNAQTAITIDFANNSVVRAQTAAGLVVTLSSFVVGKSVEAWITNTAGGGQTFTHGCTATNSTVNSTTYSIPATSTIFVKYWCMDGTLANTFVAITK